MIARHRLLYGLLVIFLFAERAQAQVKWSYDHMHMAAPDPQKAIEWYVNNLGGKPSDDEGNVVPMEKAARVVFDGITFMFLKSDNAQPSSGSVIDSIGFSFPDVEKKADELQKAGAKITMQVRRCLGYGNAGR